MDGAFGADFDIVGVAVDVDAVAGRSLVSGGRLGRHPSDFGRLGVVCLPRGRLERRRVVSVLQELQAHIREQRIDQHVFVRIRRAVEVLLLG